MSLLIVTGFEHNVLTAGSVANTEAPSKMVDWSDSGPPAGSIVTSPVKSGTYAYKVTGNRYGDYVWTNSNIIALGCWFQGNDPTVETRPLFSHAYGAPNAWINTETGTGKFQVGYDTGGGSVYATADSEVCLANTWYWVDALFDLHANPWVIKWSVNGQAKTTVNVSAAAATFRWTAIGGLMASTNTAKIIYVDDMHIATGSAADYPIGGPKQVIGIYIDQGLSAEHQSITTSEWQYTDNFSSFTNFASSTETDSRSRLDDLNTTDGIRLNKGAAGQAGNARWSLADPSPDPNSAVYAVNGWMNVNEASGGTQNLIIRLLLGANTTDLINQDIGPAIYNTVLTARPGGGAFTGQDIRDLKLEIDSTDSTPNIYVYGVFLEVSYALVGPQPPVIVPSVPVLGRASW